MRGKSYGSKNQGCSVSVYSCFLHHGVPVSQRWDVTKYNYSCSVLKYEFEGLNILMLSNFKFPLHSISEVSTVHFIPIFLFDHLSYFSDYNSSYPLGLICIIHAL